MEQENTKRVYAMLGTLIRQHRNAAELTQDDVSTSMGVDRRHYGQVESRQSKVSVVRLIEICGVLGIKTADLIQQLDDKLEI